ncbi:MAG: hypothetical protein QGG40_08425 [Myxococcota bacterium]|jgi:hypothetical protein|nr:hypothetical protein [Myxococcota bacterium]
MRRLWIGLFGVLGGGLSPALADDGAVSLAVDAAPGEIEPWLDFRDRLEATTAYTVDTDGAQVDTPPVLNSELRMGARVQRTTGGDLPGSLEAVIELGLGTGDLWGRTALDGEALPGTEDANLTLRQAYARWILANRVRVQAGAVTSQWGLGMLANGGQDTWTRGSASFVDARGGDTVLRGMIATGPHGAHAIKGRGLVLAGFLDHVLADATLMDGDRAWQTGAALTLGGYRRDQAMVGLYGVYRHLDAEDGDTMDARVVDLTGRLPMKLGARDFTVESELAVVTGKTTLGGTTDHPAHDLLQFGGVLRASCVGEGLGGVLDLIYASGDQNPDDATQHGFRIDANFPSGLLLYRNVLAAQTGRAVATAGDPDLVGYPSEDLERFATRGSITNSLAVFPRFVWPWETYELYGGPLFAWSEVAWTDPLQTRVVGGVPRNSLGAEPGGYLGTELDLGLQWIPTDRDYTGGFELAALLPGSALADTEGDTSPVLGGRFLFHYVY